LNFISSRTSKCDSMERQHLLKTKKMKATNTKNLPIPIADAIAFSDFFPAGQLSASKLIDSSQIASLKKVNSVEEDVSDKVWTLISKALLQVIENGSESQRHRRAYSIVISSLTSIQDKEKEHEKDAQREEAIATLIGNLDALLQSYYPPTDRYLIRQSYAVEFEETYVCFKGTDKEFTDTKSTTIFDTIPLYDKETKTLYYTKICNTFHATKSDLRNSWVRESNMQAYILQVNGFDVEKIEAIMIFKDFSAARVDSPDYPKSQIETMLLPLHRSEDIEKLIHIQLKKHMRAYHGDVAECTPSERWAESDSWSVKTKGLPRAHKTGLQSIEEAEAWLGANRVRFINAEVEFKKGKSRRCESYCPVREHCQQFKNEQLKNKQNG